MTPGGPGDAHEEPDGPALAVKTAARTAMSTWFSFVPARRRSREAQRALEPAADSVAVGDGGCSAGRLRRHVGEGRLQASQALLPVGRVASLPVEAEGPSADGRGTGHVHDERAAKRSGCVSAGMPQIDPTASAHQETSKPRHRLTTND
jgi:hypothetical protein